MAQKSRAEYYRNRRENLKSFMVLINRDKAISFERYLKEKGLTKTEWLNKRIDDELEKQ